MILKTRYYYHRVGSLVDILHRILKIYKTINLLCGDSVNSRTYYAYIAKLKYFLINKLKKKTCWN